MLKALLDADLILDIWQAPSLISQDKILLVRCHMPARQDKMQFCSCERRHILYKISIICVRKSMKKAADIPDELLDERMEDPVRLSC